MKVTCKQANVWTSKGKLIKGESADVSAEEAKALGSAVETEAPKKAKTDK